MQLSTNGSLPPEPQTNQKTTKWSSYWQLGLSLLGIMVLWGFAITLVLMVLSTAISMPTTAMVGDSMPLLLLGAGMGFGGILLLPSAWYALLDILNRPEPVKKTIPQPGLLVIFVPILVVLGNFVAKSPILAWVGLPPIHVLTIGISVLWLASLGTRGLPLDSKQRMWGIFGAGMVAAPFLSLLAEIVVIIAVSILGISYLALDPDFAQGLAQISESYLANPNQPPDELFNFLEPYLTQPIVLYAGMLVVAILVPLIEEFFKPIGVWLLAKRKPSPSEGFTAGIISGAGFALFENYTLSASSGEDWAIVVVARMGTSIIHILTTGLTGWALALAWKEGRYLKLGLTYLVSVTIHALWNGLAVVSIIPELMPGEATYPNNLNHLSLLSPIGFFILLAGGFVLLLLSNSNLKRAIMSSGNASTDITTSQTHTTEGYTPLDAKITEENHLNGDH